ncbi:helix-turn-helix transcriptional regulator [Nocardioides sp. W3-2-3]|nr:helix-turn-helix transcriptional regulator [Nocardioides convexus]
MPHRTYPPSAWVRSTRWAPISARSISRRSAGASARCAPPEAGRRARLAGENLSTGYVSRIEGGTRRPTMKVLRDLAERLGTTTEQACSTASSVPATTRSGSVSTTPR